MSLKQRDPYRRVEIRRRFMLLFWVVLATVLLGRAAEVQVAERFAWREDAAGQQLMSRVVPAPRGRILDRNGSELAVSHWRAAVAVAPSEIRDRKEVGAALEQHLGLRPDVAHNVSVDTRPWRVVRGRYSMTQVEGLRGLRGVHVQGELRRLYPREKLARGLLGVVQEGVGTGGIEQTMDSVLAGRTGREIVERDNRGREIPGKVITVQEPLAGRDVVLTIDEDLQALAEELLAMSVDSTGARGGDLVITDPRTGEVLAIASLNDGSTNSLSAVNAPYEPGSTIKPFTTAALLRHRVASLADSVDTGTGSWEVGTRQINDIHGGGWLTLYEVVQRSSNVGIAKFAEGLTEAQQYTNLRDFGFGTRTGIMLPGEAAGMLRRPDQWSALSGQSLAFGYELSVTSLQMAMAFGALANDGWLMEPRLIREVRDRDGRPVRFGSPRTVRRAVPRQVTEALRPVLVDVVEQGTGTRARMSSFLVAGKSGTARAVGDDGRYEGNAYFASFGAFFPADDPQLLLFAKLDRPSGEYYGGAVAAPLTRAMLEGLLPARRVPLDRGALALARRPVPSKVGNEPVVHFAAAARENGVPVDALRSDVLGSDVLASGALGSDALGAGALGSGAPIPPARSMSVPDLNGAPIRVAIRRLHRMGLRVWLDGGGAVLMTVPPAGTGVAVGDTVRVLGQEG